MARNLLMIGGTSVKCDDCLEKNGCPLLVEASRKYLFSIFEDPSSLIELDRKCLHYKETNYQFRQPVNRYRQAA